MHQINDFLSRLVFFVAMDVRVVGQNGEFADYDNPQGYIYGDVYYVKARIEGDKFKGDGLQWAHKHSFVNNEAGATALMERIKQHIEIGRLNEDLWSEDEPVYGTQAWLDWNAEHPETWND